MKKLTLLIASILLLAPTAFCQLIGGGKFKAYVLTAPEKQFNEVKKIAIVEFSNAGSQTTKASGIDLGTKLGDYLTAQLLEEYRGASKDKIYIVGAQTNVFELIERSRLDAVMKEQNLQSSGIVDEGQAVELGKLLGLDAIIIGSISYSYTDVPETKKYTDKNGKTTYTYELRRTVTTEARMKIISIKTAQVLGTTNSSISDSDYKSSDTRMPSASELKEPIVMADNCSKYLASNFADYFCPRYVYMDFEIEKIKAKEYKDRAEEAYDYLVKKGDIDKAYPIYKAIFDADNYNPQVAYNMGVIYEVVGDFEKAFSAYSIAYNLNADDKTYSSAYKRAERGKILIEDLTKMGINISPHEFTEGGSLEKKILTKGSKNDRYSVFKEMNETSEVVAKIPGGGFKLILVEQLDGWFLAKLPDGKQGYISSKDAKEE